MSEISDISSILKNSLLLANENKAASKTQAEIIKDRLNELPKTIDKQTLSILKNDNNEFGVSLKQYTDLSTYSTVMNTLYGNKSANKFQNTLNMLTDSADDELATAKAFINKMKENGMSNQNAVKTYSALKKYSLMTSLNNYNFVNSKV